MDIDLILLGAFLAVFSLFSAVITLQRIQWRRKNKLNKNHRIFYPSATALSLAILSLQTLAQPDRNHALEQRQSEDEDEEENGDPDDPAAQLNRQLKRIRNGENVGALKVPLNIYQTKMHSPNPKPASSTF